MRENGAGPTNVAVIWDFDNEAGTNLEALIFNGQILPSNNDVEVNIRP